MPRIKKKARSTCHSGGGPTRARAAGRNHHKAAAAGAKIVLVEANSSSTTDLMTAVKTAARQASVVSMSWGGSEFPGETAYDTAAYFAKDALPK